MGDINLSYQPQLVDQDDLRDNTSITICDSDLCENENYELVIQFDSNPAPRSAEWHIRNNDRRRKTSVREGNKRRNYDAEYVENIHNNHHPDRFEARLMIDRI